MDCVNMHRASYALKIAVKNAASADKVTESSPSPDIAAFT